MAGHRLTATHLSRDRIGDYLAELETLLRGPRRNRRRVLDEIRDGLTETVDARIADGTAPDRAATAAIAEFGDPQTVAGSFSAEMATATARDRSSRKHSAHRPSHSGHPVQICNAQQAPPRAARSRGTMSR